MTKQELEITLKIDLSELDWFEDKEEENWFKNEVLKYTNLVLLSGELGDAVGEVIEVLNYKITNYDKI